MPRRVVNASRKWPDEMASSCRGWTWKHEKKWGPKDLFGGKCGKTGLFYKSLIDNGGRRL
jgi:hypothetical protein